MSGAVKTQAAGAGAGAAAAPPQALQQQQRLRPVYSALDSHNYSKVLKLTLAEPVCSWDLTKALRIIALDRIGKKRDALALLRDVLGHGCFDELEDRIAQIDVGRPIKAAAATVGGAATSSASIGGGGGGKYKGGKKGKGKKFHTTASTLAPKTPAEDSSAGDTAVDYVDLLDVPAWKRQMQRREKYLAENGGEKKDKLKPNVVADEVVLATLKVSLLSQRLNQTLAQLYAFACESISGNPLADKEELCSILHNSYFAQMRLACTYPRTAHVVAPDYISDKHIWEAERIAGAYESAQLAGMSLARLTGSPLHQSWVAHAALLHHEANADAVKLMEAKLSFANNDAAKQRVDKLKAKMAMLPRLAESLMSRVVSRAAEGETSEIYPPSAEDWNLYIRALVEQKKFSDALAKLEQVECASGFSTSGSDRKLRRINDERDIAGHDGSLLQLAHRDKLEQMASLFLKVERYDDAKEKYMELINLQPNNWNYWNGYLRSSISPDSNDEDIEKGIRVCRKSVEAYLLPDGDSSSLRGPHLFLVELASIPLRGLEAIHAEEVKNDISRFLEKDFVQREALVRSLAKAIIDYAEIFASKASCCFMDLRHFIELFTTACYQLKEEPAVWGEAISMLTWARELREDNSCESDAGIADTKERRQRLRSYIFSIQIMFGVLRTVRDCDAFTDTYTSESLNSYLPSLNDMVSEWQTSLDLGSNAKEGDQKEVLPGDELILLACQYADADKIFAQTSLITAAALLEAGVYHSPYNPHLKIAAINVYSRLSAGQRAFELFHDMGVKHIQYDSCSYLIFPALIKTGLYREAVQLAGNVMRLHWNSARDVQDFSTKCLETGMLSKCGEMCTFQRQRMTNSLQLLASKSTVMDLASLVYSGEPDERGKGGSTEPLGAHNGLCGGDHDLDRVAELIQNIGNFSAAPSILNIPLDGMSPSVDLYSDNRDLSVNQFYILSQSDHSSKEDIIWYSTTQALLHGLLMRAALLIDAAKAPKKGKPAKVKEGDLLHKRCLSLFKFLLIVDHFIESSSKRLVVVSHEHEKDFSGGRAIANLARVLCVVAAGMGTEQDDEDTLSGREKQTMKILGCVRSDIDKVRQTVLSSTSDSSGQVCRLLSEVVVPMFALMQMNGHLFALFGWGKKKRHTKAGAGALAETADCMQNLAMDMLGALVSSPTDAPTDDACKPTKNMCTYLFKEGKGMLEAARKHVERSHIETRQRVMPFLDQIIASMKTDYLTDEAT